MLKGKISFIEEFELSNQKNIIGLILYIKESSSFVCRKAMIPTKPTTFNYYEIFMYLIDIKNNYGLKSLTDMAISVLFGSAECLRYPGGTSVADEACPPYHDAPRRSS
jgi:hypothetical protein